MALSKLATSMIRTFSKRFGKIFKEKTGLDLDYSDIDWTGAFLMQGWGDHKKTVEELVDDYIKDRGF